MRIGIDIDDTLTETSEVMERVALKHDEEYNNKLASNIPNLLRGVLEEEEVIDFFKNHSKEVCGQAKVKDDTKKIIDILLEEGHEIIFITARSDDYFDNSYEFTEKYLKDNNVNYTELITGHEYKLDICKEKDIDVFFDDAYDTVKTLYDEGIDAVLFTSRNNVYLCTSLNRVNDWKELYQYICNK